MPLTPINRASNTYVLSESLIPRNEPFYQKSLLSMLVCGVACDISKGSSRFSAGCFVGVDTALCKYSVNRADENTGNDAMIGGTGFV